MKANVAARTARDVGYLASSRLNHLAVSSHGRHDLLNFRVSRIA